MTETMKSRRVTKNGHSLDLVRRILDTLDWLPMEASERLGVPVSDIIALMKGTCKQLVPLDQDEVWVKLADHVDRRIGALLAVRSELQRKLNVDRAERAAQRLRTLNR